MNVTIRKFEKQDKEKIGELLESSLIYFEKIDTLEIIEPGKNYAEWAADNLLKKIQKGGIIFVAIEGAEVVGFIAGTVNPLSEEEQMELKNIQFGSIQELHISQEFRYKGIGTLLLQEMETYFKNCHCVYSVLHVLDANSNARNLYTKMSYKDRTHMMLKKL